MNAQETVKPVVSFCVPVYNNAHAALEIVKSLLSSDDSRFEVVVSDDNSRENVEEVLSVIHDSRFRYCRNTENIGAHRNWERSLELGRGEWLYLIMARDRVHGENISRLIDILDYARENGITCLKDGYRPGTFVWDGIRAMIEFVYVEHPSGDIYSRKVFAANPERMKYFETSDMYPEAKLRFSMLLEGKGAYVTSGVYIYTDERLVDFTKTRSGVDTESDIFDTYYAPRRTAVQIFELIDIMDNCGSGKFTKSETDKFFRAKFSELIMRVTELWVGRCSDESWQKHYGHSVRHVSVRELVSNIFTAFTSTKAHLQEKGTLNAGRLAAMYYYCAKALPRWTLYYPFKNIVRKILKPLGVWDFLKRILGRKS